MCLSVILSYILKSSSFVLEVLFWMESIGRVFPFMNTFFNSILPYVKVPVLLVQISLTLPIASQASNKQDCILAEFYALFIKNFLANYIKFYK